MTERIDPELVDMAAAWGIVDVTDGKGPGHVRRLVSTNDSAATDSRSANNSQRVFADGKRLIGRDLGAKGVLRSRGSSNWARPTPKSHMKR